MSVIGTGNHTILAAPGRPMLAGPLPSSTGGLPAGLTGWWDASAPSGLISPQGSALTAFGASVGAVADQSGTANVLTVWHASSGVASLATPRLNGLLGGVGRNTVVPPT